MNQDNSSLEPMHSSAQPEQDTFIDTNRAMNVTSLDLEHEKVMNKYIGNKTFTNPEPKINKIDKKDISAKTEPNFSFGHEVKTPILFEDATTELKLD